MLQKLTSILFNTTEIPIWMNALLEYILTALLEYIDLLLKQIFARAHVPPAHPSLKDESNNKLLCCVITISYSPCYSLLPN